MIDHPLGLYVHIPFCASICNYCNFNRGLFDADQKSRYVRALIAEIGRPVVPGANPALDRPAADTIYFGGGTPSLLTAEEVAAIVEACRASFTVPADAEITLEANPETVSLESLKSFRDAGVNRLSFGVQSFRDVELQRLSRRHGAERARTAYADARGAGFDNVSLDLMMWLPEQTVAGWMDNVNAAIALAPDHLSLYMLEVYPNAPLKDDMARAAWSQAPDDDVAEMYESSMARLESAGYEQYEISNVARPGRQSRHNLKYWRDGAWYGFGCGAHSTVEGVRWKNVSGIDDYIARIDTGQSPAVEVLRLSRDARLGDAIFTGLRLNEGLDVRAVDARYGDDIWARFGQRLQPYCEGGLLEVSPERWRLTRHGMLLAHEVMAVFV